MKRHGFATFFFITLANVAYATKPLVTLDCLIADGVIEEDQIRIPKVDSAVAPVSFDLQQTFEDGLTELVSIPMAPAIDQCRLSCATYSYSTFLTLLDPDSIDYSSGYITAQHLEMVLNQVLQGELQEVRGTANAFSIELALRTSGVMTEEQFPSSSEVNIPALVDTLNKIASLYREELSGHKKGDKEYNRLMQEATAIGSEAIQLFFGKYPTWVSTDQAIKQFERLMPRTSEEKKINILSFQSYDRGKEAITEQLNKRLPVQLEYNVAGNHQGDGVYRRHSEVIGSHSVVITGMYFDRSGTIYYQAQNSHAHAPILYLSEPYLIRHFEAVYFFNKPTPAPE